MALTLVEDGKDLIATWRFGGGRHTASAPRDINERESAGGRNQDLQLDNGVFRKRKSIELVGTTPNALRINGFADLVKPDGSVSALIQAGQQVYRWFGGAASFIPKAAEFDGSNDYLLRGGGLTGAEDGKKFMFGAWIFAADVSSGQNILFSTNEACTVGINSSGIIAVGLENAAGTVIGAGTATTALTINTWTHVLISVALDAGRLQIFYNDTDVSPTSPTITDDDVDYTVAEWAIGASVSGTSLFDGRLGPLYVNIAESVDISVEDTRRMWYGESSTSRDLEENGKNPTGNQPAIYLSGNSTNYQVNHGSGGNFAVTGALTEPATNPPDGSSFVRLSRVPLGSRLRGGRHSTSLIDSLVVISDLALLADILTWDGTDSLTAFANLAHNLGGTLRAKYAVVELERLLLAHVRTTTTTPHVLLASKRGDIKTFTESNRPASGVGEGDSWFLPIEDFKPINALLTAYGRVILSTEEGQIWQLLGSNSTDFTIDSLFPDSGARGDNAVANIGNDVIFGRHGKIDSLVGVQAFGDVETDDISRWISNEVENVTEWEIIYNPRLGRAYCWPLTDNFGRGGRLYVLVKALYDPIRRRTVQVRAGGDAVSPWARWETTFGEEDFHPTAAALMRNPFTKLDHVYFGDDAGRIFQLEGEGLQDGGSVSITTVSESPLVILPGDRDGYDFKGYVLYEEHASTTLVLNLLYQGTRLFDSAVIDIVIPDPATFSVFGGDVYFGGNFYFGTLFYGRLNRLPFSSAGKASAFQIRASVATDSNLAVHEIGLRFTNAVR